MVAGATPSTAIRVINLATSHGRRESFAALAKGNGLDWEFFPACVGPTKPVEYDARAATRRCGRPLSPSEIGCYASHFKIWEWLANSDYDQAIILEDDVIVDWSAIEEIAAHRFADHAIDLLRLFISHPFYWKIVKYRLLSPHIHLVRPVGMAFGTQAYLLTKAAARVLVAKYALVTAPLDWVVGRYWEHQLNVYSLAPFPVIERHASSVIGESQHQATKRAFSDRVVRVGWRIRDRAQRAYVEACLLKKYPLGPTEDCGPPFLQSRQVKT